VEIYLHVPYMPSWRGAWIQGQLYLRAHVTYVLLYRQ
jgi:hypothetical protein